MRFVCICVIGGLLGSLLGACSTPRSLDYPPSADASGLSAIHIVSHGWHTGIVFEAGQALKVLPIDPALYHTDRYVEIGWGDEGFYRAESITTPIALGALLWPTPSVLHIVGLRNNPYKAFPASEVLRIPMSNVAVDAMLDFINTQFLHEPGKLGEKLGPGLYGKSYFFRGVEKYHGFNTCNRWTARVLRKGGFPINDVFTLTATGVMDRIKVVLNPEMDEWE